MKAGQTNGVASFDERIQPKTFIWPIFSNTGKGSSLCREWSLCIDRIEKVKPSAEPPVAVVNSNCLRRGGSESK